MDKLFLKIYQVFDENQSLFTEAGLEPIRHIDKYRGQTQNPEQFELYDIPAMFIDYRISWQRDGRVYNGILELDFHIVTDATWPTSNLSTNKNEGLKAIQYIQLARELLDNLSSENTGKMLRLSEQPMDADVVSYHVLRYTCNYYDTTITGKKYASTTPEDVDLSGKLKTHLL